MNSVFNISGVGFWPLNVLRHCSTRRAEMPVTTGDDMEVPFNERYPLLGAVENWATPLATTSGFTRPSRVGPRELKSAISPLTSTAPTATTFFVPARTPIVV